MDDSRTRSSGVAGATSRSGGPRRPPDRRITALPDPASAPRPWLDRYPPGVPETYAYPAVPLTRLLDDAVVDFGDREAVFFAGRSLTYHALADQVDRFATALAGLGVGKGDRVGVALPNCPQHVLAVLAALRLGAVVVPHDPRQPVVELEQQVTDAGPKVLVCLDAVYERLAALKGRLPTVRHVVVTGITEGLPLRSRLRSALLDRRSDRSYRIPRGERVLWLHDLVERTAPTVPQTPVQPDTDLAFLLYKGRGPALRGVKLTHANLVANAVQLRLWIPDAQAGQEHVLAVMPFFHAFGLTTGLLFGLLTAATLTLEPRFERAATLRTIHKRRPTLLAAVPAVFEQLIAGASDAGQPRSSRRGRRSGGGSKGDGNGAGTPRLDLSSIRVGLSGAATLSPDSAERFEALTGGKAREVYGLTEASPITHANPVYGKAKPGSIGLPVTDTVAIAVDPNDPSKAALAGEPGRLAVSGPQVMRGYWNRPELTAGALRDGWLVTDDVVRIDDHGYATVVERSDLAAG